MAKNLREKLPSTAELFIYDVYAPSLDRFVTEVGGIGNTTICKSSAEVVEKSVSAVGYNS
jgi:hypothetical protein